MHNLGEDVWEILNLKISRILKLTLNPQVLDAPRTHQHTPASPWRWCMIDHNFQTAGYECKSPHLPAFLWISSVDGKFWMRLLGTIQQVLIAAFWGEVRRSTAQIKEQSYRDRNISNIDHQWLARAHWPECFCVVNLTSCWNLSSKPDKYPAEPVIAPIRNCATPLNHREW